MTTPRACVMAAFALALFAISAAFGAALVSRKATVCYSSSAATVRVAYTDTCAPRERPVRWLHAR